ncbi:MAG TPA: glutathione S-transferase family protein [Deltaproteobacteria bacterium]|jgi:glutathione S-transferase|nr:glutathione S-transferase family protein [Deltaproteobacteria bacterium]
MSSPYRIFGVEMSPYSVKVRSYFRYKGIPHQWIVRSLETQPEFQKYAKLPIVPLVVTPGGEGIQDSTPILERFEAERPEPSIHPSDPISAFISALLEEFGDEWGNKWMFHYRWAREVDQLSAAGRIARAMMPGASEEQHVALSAQVRERMVNRVWFVGSNAETAPQIEESFRETIALLDVHLATRPYLFGRRPAFGDFGLFGQIYEAWTDPTPGALIEGSAQHVLDWVQRMLWPRVEGEFEPWQSLEPTLLTLLERQVGRLFLPWTVANAAAIAAGREEFRVDLDGKSWTQKPQKYHAKSLAALRAKYAGLRDRAAVDRVLDRSRCLAGLRG